MVSFKSAVAKMLTRGKNKTQIAKHDGSLICTYC